MKLSSFIIFLSVVLGIYFSASIYIFFHGLHSLSGMRFLKTFYIIAFTSVTLSYIIARFLLGYGNYSWLSIFLLTVGSFWMAALVYFFLISLSADLIRLVNHFIPFYPSFITANYEKFKFVALIISITGVSSLLGYGYYNAQNPVINEVSLKFEKQIPGSGEINMVMLSDIHLGLLSCGSWFDTIVAKVNSLEPDIIILAGDVIDEDLAPVISMNLGDHLLNLRSKYGVYAITGNHEYIGGAESAVKYLTEHNITVLRDTSVLIDNKFYLTGREDRDRKRFTGKDRKQLDELIKDVNSEFPVIVLNHQPYNLEELAGKKIDL
ncbi:MAG: metallophosphoesterase, partial [Ignavibacteria bacterium]|nr:metallophosphoesterase [Ignavibacteria bacterium]